MKFIIDAQVFQTDTWHRGMGKYSLELLKALQKIGFFDDRQLEMVLNSNLKLEDDRKELLDKFLPGAVYTKLNLKLNEDNLTKAQKYNKKEISLHYNNPEDTFFIPSLFENIVTPVFPEQTRKFILGYDLIPFLFYERYMTHSEPVRSNYFGRFATLFEADHIYTISQTTADDFERHLGLPAEKLTNIDGGSIGSATNLSKPKYIPETKFILSTSGDDLRKNNERMVTALAELNKETGQHYKLLITSNFSKRSQQSLKKISKDIHFVGNVSEAELRWYYHNAETLLFVPEYEGLGLPVLEAVEAGCKVVCSNISVFQEMTTNPKTFNFCDPYDIWSIKEALQVALKSDTKPNLSDYEIIKSKYQWSHTAQKFSSTAKEIKIASKPSSKKKVAVVGPQPGGKSAIGKVVEVSHYALSQVADVDYYLEIPHEDIATARCSYVQYVANAKDISQFSSIIADKYDQVIYHMGNSTYHSKTAIEALAVPGTVILHDTRLGGLYSSLVNEHKISPSRKEAEEVLDSNLKVTAKADHLISIINSAKEIVVHSDYAKAAVKSCLLTNKPIRKLDLPIGLASKPPRIPSPKITIAIAGIIAKSKGLDLLVELLQTEDFNHYSFKLFGYDYAVDHLFLHSLNEYKNLEVLRNLSDLRFREELSKADVLLNYRDTYNGETSYSTLEAMAQGVVPIVRDIGWYGELPDDTVIKVKTAKEVAARLKKINGSPEQLFALSQRCYDHTKNNHLPGQYVSKLIKPLS